MSVNIVEHFIYNEHLLDSMKAIRCFLLVIGVICLLCYSVSAIEVPTVKMPNGDMSTTINDGATETSVGWWAPKPPCYECVPKPTPAPTYAPIGLSVTCPKTRVMMNGNAQFIANQVSGTPVLSTAAWDWVINRANGRGFGAKGQVINFKVDSFGKWRINLNVRDSVQMLNGHYTGDVYFTEKR